jgi:hypothetical protein
MTPPGGARLRLGSAAITWEQFEQFFLALLNALPEVESANRYGAPGDDQEGIDHEIVFEDSTTGAAQCRQRERFGKPEFDKAVADNEYEANRHIVATTAPATKPARKAVANTPGWELWDIDDIGLKVRTLPRVDARWLLEDQLGSQQRRDFLGPAGGLTLARWPRRFRRLLEPDRLFSHTLPLIGRGETLEMLGEFVSNPKRQIAVLPGRGGSGKSRMLLEFGRRFDSEERPILFAGEGMTLSFQSLEDELPAGPGVLVLDDAHRGENARVAIGFVEGHPEVKLVLAARPHGRDELLASAIGAGFDHSELLVLESLEPLDSEASRELAQEALPEGSEQTIEALGDATRDCQLITVLAGRLLGRDQIPLALLANEDEVREQVLLRFREEMLGQVPDTVPRDQLRQLLPIIAAVQPIRDGNRDLLARIGAALDRAEHHIVGWLDELERSGLLLRAGGLRRITPDVLGDFLLERECVDDNGNPSGYAEMLWDSFADVAAARLLVNLAELDWRIRAGTGASTLLDPVWSVLRAEYQEGHGLVRSHLLGLLEPIAIMQPERVLELAELELRNPAQTHTDMMYGASWSAEDVGRKLAPLVKDAGRHPQHTGRAMRVLWQLGRDDQRPPGQNLDHPLRVLGELGSYETGHLLYCDALLDTVEQGVADADGRDVAAVGLIHAVMVREVLTTRFSGRGRLAHQGMFIDRKATTQIRARAIAILRASALAGGDRAFAAISVIADALHVPIGYMGQGASKEVVDHWRPEQRQLITVLSEVLEAEPEPSIAAQVRDTLSQEREYSRWPSSRDRAKRILDAHAPNLDAALVHAIERPWPPGLDDTNRQQVVQRLILEHTDPDGLAGALNVALADVRAADANPRPLLGDLAHSDPQLAAGLVERAFAHPDEALIAHLGALLTRRPPGLTSRLWSSQHPGLRRVAAHAYAMDPNGLDGQDAEMLREMLVDPDNEIRVSAELAVLRLPQTDASLALELATAAAPKYPREIDHLLHGLDIAQAADQQLLVFLGWLDHADHLSWEAGKFIKRAAPRAPDRVVALLIARAQAGRDVVATSQLHGLLEGLSDPDYENALLAIRDAALDPELAWKLAYLIVPIGRGDFGELVDILVEWLVDLDQARVRAACSLLRELPWQVIFDRHNTVASAVDRASPEHLDRVRGALLSAASSGMKTREFGVPADNDVTRRKRAEAIADELAEGSVGQAFFTQLANWFSKSIESDLSRDEEEDMFGR